MPSAVDVLMQLREIFPHQQLEYLKKAAAFYKNNTASLAEFVINAQESQIFPTLNTQTDAELEEYLRLQFGTLRELLPDAEETYLKGLFDAYAGSSAMEHVALEAVTYNSYPKKRLPKKENIEFDVKLYCEVIPDPLGSYSHPNYIMTDKMKADATNYLVKIFGEEERAKIYSHIDKERSLYSAYKKMREEAGEANGQLCSETLKTMQPKTFGLDPDYDQTFEKLFIENEGIVLSYLQKKWEDEEMMFEQERSQESLQNCEICCEDRVSVKMIKICEDGHVICSHCVKTNTEFLFNQSILFFPCVYNCNLYICDTAIRYVWDTSRYSKLLEERLINSKENDIVCPFCNFCNEKSESQEIVCSYCCKKFCVSCKKMAHSPLECHKKENDMCKSVEESMTNALIRKCPNCKTPFIKEASCCNRIQCVKCFVYVCYICRKIVTGQNYSHFYGQGVMPAEAPELCPLHSDINILHVHNIVETGKKAFEKIQAENPNMEMVYDPLACLPVAGKSDAVPNQY